MAEAEMSGWKSWITVAEEVQTETCQALGVDPYIGISYMRIVHDPSLYGISLYRRHNRVSPCTIREGSTMPATSLYRVDAKTKQLTLDPDPWHRGDPNTKLELVITGSVT
jgi:hypothetical protein